MNMGIGGRWCFSPATCVLALLFTQISLSSETVITLEFLGNLPGGEAGSLATSVSADGMVVCGHSGNALGAVEAFRWENGIMTGLGDLPGGDFASWSAATNADGSIVVGNSQTGSGREAFRWENGIMTGLGELPGGAFESRATGISADGSVIVGYSLNETDTYEAVLWSGGEMLALGNLLGTHTWSQAFGVSADGSKVLGAADSESGREAFYWENGSMVGLGDLPGGGFSSFAMSATNDSTYIVGAGTSSAGQEACYWINNNLVVVGDLPTGDTMGWLLGVCEDGSVMIGFGYTSNGMEAMACFAKDGYIPISLNSFLDDAGVDRGGFLLNTASDLSEDGTTIVGWGTNEEAELRAFILRFIEQWGPYEISNGQVDTGSWLGMLEVTLDPWTWCERVPCWFNIPEQSATAGKGWVYPPHHDTLQIVQIEGTNWGYSFALEKWLYLTANGWVYMV